MRNGGPWRVRGIRAETRDTAREAARRSGMSVGEWLDSVVVDSAAEEGIRPAAPRRRHHEDDDFADFDRHPTDDIHGVHDRLDELTRHLDRLSRASRSPRQVYPAPAYREPEDQADDDFYDEPAPRQAPSHAPAPTPVSVVVPGFDQVAEAISRLDSRLDQLITESRAATPEPYLPPRPVEPHLAYAPPAHRTSSPYAYAPQPAYAEPAYENWAPQQSFGAPFAPQNGYQPQPELPARMPNFAEPPGRPWMGLVDEALAEIKAKQQALDSDIADFRPLTQDSIAAAAAARAADPRPVAPAPSHYPPGRPVAGPQPQAGYAQQPQPSASIPPLPSQNLHGLEQQLRHITQQIETIRTPALEQSIESLRNELREIARSVLDAVPRRAIDALEHEVKNLIARVDNGRSAGIDSNSLSALEKGLGEIHQTLRTMTPAENLGGIPEAVASLARKIDTIGTAQHDPAAINQLEEAICALREIVAHVASNDALSQLTTEVRTLADRVEKVAGTSHGAEVLATLETRIAYIADALEARAQNGGSVPPQLEAVIKGLSDKIERVQSSAGDNVALGQLEEHIVKLVEKLDASGARLTNLEAIERGLADILSYLEGQRGKSGAGSETLHRDLTQTKDSLEAVHGTLSHVVNRIAMLEKDMLAKDLRAPDHAAAPYAPPMPQAAPAMPRAPQIEVAQAPVRVPQVQAPMQAQMQAPIQAPIPAAAPPVAHQPSRAAQAAAIAFKGPANGRAPIDPNLPPDHPLEPGHRAQGESPAARIAASEAALGRAKPPVVAHPDSKANYIEAARRAARTAAQSEPSADAFRPVAEEPLRPIPGTGSGGKFAGRIKSLLVGASVVILIGAALHMGLGLLHGDESGSDAPKATPQSGAVPGTKTSSAGPAADGDVVGSIAKHFNYGPRVTPKGNAEEQSREQAKRTATVSSTGEIGMTAPAPTLPATRPTETAVTGDSLPDAIGSSPLRMAAMSGNAAAQYEAGARYAEGRGVPLDLTAAARWFERAANQGIAIAQFRLGNLYEKGNGVPKNIDTARRLYLLAAEQDNAKAMHNLAVLYAEGVKGKPDYQNASLWFRRAADHGVSDSQYNLGILYARGIGLPANLAESYKWFSLAAAQGDPEAAKKRDEITKKMDYKTLENARRATQEWILKPQAPSATDVRSPPGGWDGPDLGGAPAGAKASNAPVRIGSR
jgi:localization factor PodJL